MPQPLVAAAASVFGTKHRCCASGGRPACRAVRIPVCTAFQIREWIVSRLLSGSMRARCICAAHCGQSGCEAGRIAINIDNLPDAEAAAVLAGGKFSGWQCRSPRHSRRPFRDRRFACILSNSAYLTVFPRAQFVAPRVTIGRISGMGHFGAGFGPSAQCPVLGQHRNYRIAKFRPWAAPVSSRFRCRVSPLRDPFCTSRGPCPNAARQLASMRASTRP